MRGGQFSHFRDKMCLARDTVGQFRDDPGHSGTVGNPYGPMADMICGHSCKFKMFKIMPMRCDILTVTFVRLTSKALRIII